LFSVKKLSVVTSIYEYIPVHIYIVQKKLAGDSCVYRAGAKTDNRQKELKRDRKSMIEKNPTKSLGQ